MINQLIDHPSFISLAGFGFSSFFFFFSCLVFYTHAHPHLSLLLYGVLLLPVTSLGLFWLFEK